MAKVNIDYGQGKIAAFNDAARAGTIHFEEAAVREAVALYDRMITGLHAARERLQKATQASGFGGFESAQQLQAGFSNKAAEGMIAINHLIEGAMRLQEAYLRAGNLITEADQIHADALRFAEKDPGLGDARA
ncbi:MULTISPECIES: hypothetical protein [unclassified Nocardia]|uniref:hypothetical protein n=1 Tax=unclassified Nocardia TaxID=2637762 RepID=UPI001CE496D8|nr:MULTISPECIES: hypothetical protein [unclassified Nocardia]